MKFKILVNKLNKDLYGHYTAHPAVDTMIDRKHPQIFPENVEYKDFTYIDGHENYELKTVELKIID